MRDFLGLYQSRVERLDEILEEILPTNGDSLWRRTKKTFSSLDREKEVREIRNTLQHYSMTLIHHQVTGSSIGIHKTDKDEGVISSELDSFLSKYGLIVDKSR